jgi:RNase P/RNase MRP subunit POP5
MLFEHKSFSDPLISLHLLRYMVRIWEHALKQGEARPLPPIIPVVIYHGRVQWRVGLEFCNLFNLPGELEGLVPNFQYLLCDLSRYNDEEIKGAVTLRAGLLLLKHIFSEDLGERLPGILKLLSSLLEKRSGLEYLETILRYVASGSDKIREEDIESAVREVLRKNGGDIMPTVAEKWIEQGMQQGMQQGVEQGMQRGFMQALRGALIEVLEDRFETVPRTLMKSLGEINDPDLLKSLHKKALRASSSEEFKNAVKAALA